jgi:hypothetical protein
VNVVGFGPDVLGSSRNGRHQNNSSSFPPVWNVPFLVFFHDLWGCFYSVERCPDNDRRFVCSLFKSASGPESVSGSICFSCPNPIPLNAPLPDPLKRYPYSDTLTRTLPRSLPAEGNGQTVELKSYYADAETKRAGDHGG